MGIIKIQDAMMLILVALTVFSCGPRDMTGYRAKEFDSVRITYSTMNSRYEIVTSDTNVISSFFSITKYCWAIPEEKTSNRGTYDLTFYGKTKAIFAIDLVTDGRIILDDFTPNYTLTGSRYRCDSLNNFVAELKKLKMKKVPMP